jgi:hypothetical protein
MQRQGSTLARKLTLVLILMAVLKILIVLATLAHGVYWAFLVLGCAGSLSILVLMASASLPVRTDEHMLEGSRHFADASLVDIVNRNPKEMVSPMKEANESSEDTPETVRIIHEIAFQANLLALGEALQGVRWGEEGMSAGELGSGTQQTAQSIAKCDADARLEAVVESARKLTGQTERAQTNAAAAGEEVISHSQSLWSLVGEVRRLSGASAAPEPTWPPEAEAASKRVGVLASIPGRTSSQSDKNEAAS